MHAVINVRVSFNRFLKAKAKYVPTHDILFVEAAFSDANHRPIIFHSVSRISGTIDEGNRFRW